MKKFSIVLLTLIMLLSFAACDSNKDESNAGNSTKPTGSAGVQATVSGNDTTPSTDSDPVSNFAWMDAPSGGGIEITGYIGSSKKVVVPEIINNKKVVSIAATAFDGNVVIEELVLPKSIKGEVKLSGCDNLKYLEIQCTEMQKDYNKITKDDIRCALPKGIKTLAFPNATIVNMHQILNREYGDHYVEELIMPKAEFIVVSILSSEKYVNLKEITISDEIQYMWGGSNQQLFNKDQYDENLKSVREDEPEWLAGRPVGEDKKGILGQFGVDTLKINGKTYSK